MHNFKTIIRNFEKKMSSTPHIAETNLWNYITALRGNDDGEEYFKLYITCVIRGKGVYAAFDISRCPLTFDSFVTKSVHIKRIKNSLHTVSYHSRTHAESGFRALAHYYSSLRGKKNYKAGLLCHSMAHNISMMEPENYYNDLVEFIKLME